MFRTEYIPQREAFRVTYTDENDGTKSKILSPDEYYKFIKKALHNQEPPPKYHTFTQMPKEFLRARMDVEKWTGSVAYLLPAGTYPVLTVKEGNAMVRFPQTLWHFNVSKGAVSGLSLFCLFDELSPTTVCYRLPFPNCYENGHICIGGNRWTFKDFSDFQDLVGRFFSAPHNGDLFEPERLGVANFAELLKKISADGLTREYCIPVKEFGKLDLLAFSK